MCLQYSYAGSIESCASDKERKRRHLFRLLLNSLVVNAVYLQSTLTSISAVERITPRRYEAACSRPDVYVI